MLQYSKFELEAIGDDEMQEFERSEYSYLC